MTNNDVERKIKLIQDLKAKMEKPDLAAEEFITLEEWVVELEREVIEWLYEHGGEEALQ